MHIGDPKGMDECELKNILDSLKPMQSVFESESARKALAERIKEIEAELKRRKGRD